MQPLRGCVMTANTLPPSTVRNVHGLPNNVYLLFSRQPQPLDCPAGNQHRRWMELGYPLLVDNRIAVLPTRAEPGFPGWVANVYVGTAPVVSLKVTYGSSLRIAEANISLTCVALAANGALFMEFSWPAAQPAQGKTQ